MNSDQYDIAIIGGGYADIFQENGGSVLLNTMVQNIDVREGEINIDTNNGTLNTKHVINCAGLYSDKVAEMMGQDIGVHIIPFRGEYYKLSSSAEHLVKGLIYPVPDPRFPFLGVHYTRNIHGYVEAGPNAVLAFQTLVY